MRKLREIIKTYVTKRKKVNKVSERQEVINHLFTRQSIKNKLTKR
jgi:hypothetical protein